MSVREMVVKSFDETLDNLFKGKKESIWRLIKNHERKNLCIDNICKEIRKAEISNGIDLKREHIEFISEEYAKTFSKVVLQHAEQEAMTQLQKDVANREHYENLEIEKMFEEEIEEVDRSQDYRGEGEQRNEGA